MRRFPALSVCALLLAGGCAHRASARQALPQAWRFEAEATRGEVRVLPMLPLFDGVPVETASYVGRTVPWERQVLRAERTAQVEAVPEALGERLPGAVNAVLAETWEGQFHHAGWPLGAEGRLRQALRERATERDALDEVLAEVGRGGTSEATLVTWVDSVDGSPVSLLGFPGELVDTPVGPVHVDHRAEPYVVTLDVGVALVTRHGDVLIRYEDRYRALLSGRDGERDAAAALARSVARDVTKVWATEAELARSSGQL